VLLPVFKPEALIVPSMFGFPPVRCRHVSFRRYLSVGINAAFKIPLPNLACVLRHPRGWYCCL